MKTKIFRIIIILFSIIFGICIGYFIQQSEPCPYYEFEGGVFKVEEWTDGNGKYVWYVEQYNSLEGWEMIANTRDGYAAKKEAFEAIDQMKNMKEKP